MGDAAYIIGSIMSCFVQVFDAIWNTVIWCGYSWGNICITFLVLDILLGFVLWLINHPRPTKEVDDGHYHGGADAKEPDGWYKSLYKKSGETYDD